ncbi:50S ribosomal protein L9 [Fluviispira multicolorata]|uniref:Large ribosomal subunit protein bL9 n=1 Tax=Fluviispira multicolorata TaxID=2654512 RepID=A0A833JCX8_9BACT|nr:50S ribosomal protein L9 [Fluviispira multicolorata]KAB8029907.1 50S ribosomal protein L9 [Fluviispira multicolorata]
MLVLLQANVPNLGHIGDLIKVKSGYARNYLFPRKLAVLADERNQKSLEHQRRQADLKKQKELAVATELAATISALSLTIQKPVGEEDKIFGTVTTQELADAFHSAGHEIDRRMITIIDEIKLVGVYKGSVKLHPEVSAQFNIWVVAQN